MSVAAGWVAALLAAGAVGLLLSWRARPVEPTAPGSAATVDRAPVARLRLPVAALSGAGAWAVLGGPLGAVACVAAVVAVWVVLGRVEPPSVVRRRERLRAELPMAIDLLGACLDSGAAPESALEAVGRAVEGPVGEELLGIHHRLRAGVPPERVWQAVSTHPQLGPVGRALGRAHETGASVRGAVHRLAQELRDQARADVEERARGIEVRASVPLGTCLLPAFVLLGVVPLVVGVFSSMRLFG